MYRLSCCAMVLSLIAANASAAIITWQVADGGNGHAYDLIGDYSDPSQRWTWETAKVMAEGMTYLGVQGHLVTITSAQEDQFLIDNFHNASPLPTWIGLTDNEDYGGTESFGQTNPQTNGWVWVTGEAVTYTNWIPNGPDGSFNREEDFALMGSQHRDHHQWNDEQRGDHAQFFVEFDLPPAAAVPEPASLFIWTTFGLSAIGVARFKGRRRELG